MKNTEIISELQYQMDVEALNGFPNDDLWNELSDTIYNIKTYGQEEDPEPIYSPQGYQTGYRLNTGKEVFFEGMTFEN